MNPNIQPLQYDQPHMINQTRQLSSKQQLILTAKGVKRKRGGAPIGYSALSAKDAARSKDDHYYNNIKESFGASTDTQLSKQMPPFIMNRVNLLYPDAANHGIKTKNNQSKISPSKANPNAIALGYSFGAKAAVDLALFPQVSNNQAQDGKYKTMVVEGNQSAAAAVAVKGEAKDQRWSYDSRRLMPGERSLVKKYESVNSQAYPNVRIVNKSQADVQRLVRDKGDAVVFSNQFMQNASSFDAFLDQQKQQTLKNKETYGGRQSIQNEMLQVGQVQVAKGTIDISRVRNGSCKNMQFSNADYDKRLDETELISTESPEVTKFGDCSIQNFNKKNSFKDFTRKTSLGQQTKGIENVINKFQMDTNQINMLFPQQIEPPNENSSFVQFKNNN